MTYINITVNAPHGMYACVCRETEYKGLQLSLDQATSKASFPYSSSTASLTENCRTPKSRVSRPKTKARLSPYTQVRMSCLTGLLSFSFTSHTLCDADLSSGLKLHFLEEVENFVLRCELKVELLPLRRWKESAEVVLLEGLFIPCSLGTPQDLRSGGCGWAEGRLAYWARCHRNPECDKPQ